MKKLVALLLCIVAVLVAKHLISNETPQNILLLYNIEALASDEITYPTKCVGSGPVDCPRIHSKVEYVFGGYSLEELF